jgi:hypothetical protein
LGHISIFLQTLKANADETAEKAENSKLGVPLINHKHERRSKKNCEGIFLKSQKLY